MANRFSVQQTEDADIETLNLSGDEVWLRTRKLRIRRRLPRMKQRLKPAGLKARKREKLRASGRKRRAGHQYAPIRRKIW